MVDIGDEIANLTFVSRDLETAYLNWDRVQDRFTASFGAVADWIARESKEAGGKVGIAGFGVEGQAGTGNDLRMNFTSPTAQALLLMSSVQSKGKIKMLGEARDREYVMVIGASCYRHPGVASDEELHTAACEPTEDLEKARAVHESLHKPFDQAAMSWLLMIQLLEGGRAAAVASQKWIHDSVIPRFYHRPWTTFGVLEDEITNVPLITPIFVFVETPAR